MDYDASLDGFLAGRRTTPLVVSGFEVMVDASAPTTAQFNVLGDVGNPFSAATVATLRRVPGTKTFQSSLLSFQFEIALTGTLDYSVTLDGIVSGRGTTILNVSDLVEAKEAGLQVAGEPASANAYGDAPCSSAFESCVVRSTRITTAQPQLVRVTSPPFPTKLRLLQHRLCLLVPLIVRLAVRPEGRADEHHGAQTCSPTVELIRGHDLSGDRA